MKKRKIIIDSDAGMDSMLGILLALASPELQVEALTLVHGSLSVEDGVANAGAVVEMAGAGNIPVAAGQLHSLIYPRQAILSPHELHAETVHPGRYAARQAVDVLIDKIMGAPGEISLLTFGPLTNLALAVRLEPNLVSAVQEVIVLGGALRSPGNTTPLAEYNLHADPHAAHIVFHSGLPLTLVPLDATHQAILQQEELARLQAFPSPLALYIAESVQGILETIDEQTGLQGCTVSAPLATSLTFAPQVAEMEALYIDVDISTGISQGKTFADFYYTQKKMPNMQAALDVNRQAFADLFLERMENLCRFNV